MPLLEKFDVYPHYGTFALTPLIDGDFEFPVDVTNDDVIRGFRSHGGSLVVYLPDLDNFEISAEIYLDQWPPSPSEPNMAFTTDFVTDGGPFKVYGLLDISDNKPVFEIEGGIYECIGRGYFSEEGNLFQVLLRKKA